MNRKLIAVAFVVAVALSACSSEDGDSPSGAAESPSQSEGSSQSPAPSTNKYGEPIVQMGETYEWPDGVKATVTSDGPYTPGANATVGSVPIPDGYSTPMLKFTYTIENGSAAVLDTSGHSHGLVSGPDRESAEYVWDDNLEEALFNNPTAGASEVPPGGVSTRIEVFAVADPDNYEFTYSRGLSSGFDSVHWAHSQQ